MRTQIQVDNQAIKDALNKLASELQVYKNVLEYTEVITGKKELLDIEQIEAEILKDSGYLNTQLVAELKGLSKEYNYIKEHINAFSIDNYNDTLEIKDSVIEAVKTLNTTYLSDEAEQINKKLLKATEILNSLDSAYSKTLKADYNGKWSVNLMALQLTCNEITRANRNER